MSTYNEHIFRNRTLLEGAEPLPLNSPISVRSVLHDHTYPCDADPAKFIKIQQAEITELGMPNLYDMKILV